MKWCAHHYESDCHGIDMIKFPSGMELCAGGTQHQDRFKFCPICGTPRPKEKTLAEKFRMQCEEMFSSETADKLSHSGIYLDLEKIALAHFEESQS